MEDYEIELLEQVVRIFDIDWEDEICDVNWVIAANNLMRDIKEHLG